MTALTSMRIRLAQKRDANAYLEIENDVYKPEYLESPESFQHRIEVFQSGCWMADCDSRSVGYLITHPWIQGECVKLNVEQLKLPNTPDCYYIHSLTLRRRYQGQGIGQLLFQKAESIAVEMGFESITLVSVQGSEGFWRKCGFQQVELATNLTDYGPDACFMMKHITD